MDRASKWTGWSPDDLRGIKAPARLIVSDADIVRPAHTVEVFQLLGGEVPGDLLGLPRSQPAALPGTTHVALVDRTDWLVPMVTAFLHAPMPSVK